MKQKRILFLVLSAVCMAQHSVAFGSDVVVQCNYDFDVSPTTYDRGSVIVIKGSTGFRMQFVQDDEMTNFDKIQASSASGDQARDLVKKDPAFAKYMSEARVFPEQIVRLDGYVVPAAASAPGSTPETANDPQARFFAFYGEDLKYLGGFGTLGKEPFTCDWVEEN